MLLFQKEFNSITQNPFAEHTLVKIDSSTIFNLKDFQPFQKVGNDKRILDSGKKLNLGEGILHECIFHGELCTYYLSYAYFDDVLRSMIKCCCNLYLGWIAQLVQRLTLDWKIAGSNLALSIAFFHQNHIFCSKKKNWGSNPSTRPF